MLLLRLARASSVLLLLLGSGCTVHEAYPPAVPAPRTPWSNAVPFILANPPPPEPTSPPMAKVPSVVPAPEEWQQWRAAPVMATTCAGRGTRRRCTTQVAGAVAQANAGALVKPTRRHTAGGQSGMVRYPYEGGQKIYQIELAVTSPTYLLLPPGERLASTVKVDPDRWDLTHVQMGQEDSRQETVVLRALTAPQEARTALLFQSGLIIFLKLVATGADGMLSVTWDLPAPPPTPPPLPLEQRPPQIDTGRLHLAYRLKDDKEPVTPPWLPTTVFDDGRRMYVHLPETGSRIPAVFGLTQTGETVLTQSRLYTRADTPEAGSWLIVQGLHPALHLKDSTGLQVTVVREPPRPSAAQGVPDAP